MQVLTLAASQVYVESPIPKEDAGAMAGVLVSELHARAGLSEAKSARVAG